MYPEKTVRILILVLYSSEFIIPDYAILERIVSNSIPGGNLDKVKIWGLKKLDLVRGSL